MVKRWKGKGPLKEVVGISYSRYRKGCTSFLVLVLPSETTVQPKMIDGLD